MSEHETDKNQKPLSNELVAVEQLLGSFAPRPSLLARDQMMFRLGQESVVARRWVWPAATTVSSVVAASLALVLLLRPTPEPQLIDANRPSLSDSTLAKSPTIPNEDQTNTSVALAPAAKATPAISSMNHLRLTRVVLSQGIDALPTWSPPADQQASPSHSESTDDLYHALRMQNEQRGHLPFDPNHLPHYTPWKGSRG